MSIYNGEVSTDGPEFLYGIETLIVSGATAHHFFPFIFLLPFFLSSTEVSKSSVCVIERECV